MYRKTIPTCSPTPTLGGGGGGGGIPTLSLTCRGAQCSYSMFPYMRGFSFPLGPRNSIYVWLYSVYVSILMYSVQPPLYIHV